ncbi:MAG: CHAT domain-containing protein [Anaerolineae bacterium]|jgi:hypothetical protein|nr:CHAT domain-containing protein [Anaerolineae bacterium]MDH7472623.1 CHAT domain-containing protein [Anaerolineae bacterium]
MDWRTALDFEVLIVTLEEGYRVSVHSPAGRAESDFSVPLSESEVEGFLLEMDRSWGVGGGALSAIELAKDCGGRLFNALFRDSILVLFRRSVNLAQREGAPLRVRLQWSDTPQLSRLPWEYLYNPATNDFLALSALTPIIRYVPGEAVRPVRVAPPLRVLGVISSPRDYPPLDIETEQGQLERALRESVRGDLLAGEQVVVEWLTRQEGESTLVALQRVLRRGDYHVFHFIGHGHFDRRYEQGALILEDTDGRGVVVNGERLGNYLRDEMRLARTLRLAVLNACQAGVPSSRGLPGGVATALVQMGIPAVIAMQAEISDEGAIAFAQSFYAAVADGWPVDLALTEGRKGIYAVSDLEWGKPVLYTCATDGHIFDIAPGLTREEANLQEQIANLYAAGRAAMSAQSWRQAVENFEAVLALDPGHREAARYLEVVKKYMQSP